MNYKKIIELENIIIGIKESNRENLSAFMRRSRSVLRKANALTPGVETKLRKEIEGNRYVDRNVSLMNHLLSQGKSETQVYQLLGISPSKANRSQLAGKQDQFDHPARRLANATQSKMSDSRKFHNKTLRSGQ